jgi:hypothetical protein
MVCGYPLPCPYHTAVIDTKEQTVTIPLKSDAGLRAKKRLEEVAAAFMKKPYLRPTVTEMNAERGE